MLTTRRNWLNRLFPWVSQSARRPAKSRCNGPRRPCRLQLESLEERVVPTVVFDPVFPKETLVGSAPFTTLHSPTIYLIFWGSGWGQGSSPGASVASTFASDAQALINSTFFKATKEYGNIGTPVFGGTWTDTSNPPAGYTSGSGNNGNFPALQGEIASAIANNPSWAPFGPVLYPIPNLCGHPGWKFRRLQHTGDLR